MLSSSNTSAGIVPGSVARRLRAAALSSAVALACPAHADAVAASRYYEDGLARFEKHDLAGAIIQLKNALQQDGNMRAAHLLLARSWLAEGNLGPAEVEFREALRLGVDRAELAIPLGRIYLMRGKPEDLIESIPADGLPAPVRIEVLTLRGTAYAALGRARESEESFAQARAIDPASAVPLVAQVPVLLTAGKPDAAREVAASAVRLAPQDPAAFNARASAAHAAGHLGDALKDYERAIALRPDHLDARVARAGILIDVGRDADAAKDLDALERAATTEPRVAYLRALLASRAGDSAGAKAHLDRAALIVDALPDEWIAGQEQLLMVGALVHHAGRQHEKARKYLSALVTRYPQNQGARKLLAAVHLETADYPLATGLLENVLRAQPDDPQALHLLGRVYLAQKRYAVATELLEKAAALDGGAAVQSSLGFARLGEGNRAAAVGSLGTAFAASPGDLGLAVTLSNLYMRQGETEKALDVARRASDALPGNPAALNLLGLIRAAAGDLKGARAAYRQAIAGDAGFFPAQLNLARVEAEEGRYDAARAIHADLLKKNRRDATAMYESALLEQRAGRPADALRWIEKAAAERPGDQRIGLSLVELRTAAGDKQGAREAARALAARRRGDLAVLAALASAEIGAGDEKAARQALAEMTRLAEFDAAMLVRIGQLQVAAADLDGAAYSATKALQGNPRDPGARVLAIEVALHQRRLDEAAAGLKRLRTDDPGSVEALRLAGDIALARKQYAAAAASYRQALERQPALTLLRRYASVCVEQGDPRAAIPAVERWLERNDGDDVARELLGELFMRNGDWRAARTVYERLVAGGDAGAQRYNNLANVLIMLDDPGAVRMAERAAALMPGDAEILDTLGWALARTGRHEEALRHLRDARLMAPANAEIRWHLGYVLAKLGRKPEARTELDAALDSGQAFPWKREARAVAGAL